MGYPYEELAQDFAKIPLDVFGAYRTQLDADRMYTGHVSQPTSKCAIVMGLSGQAEFVFDEEQRYRLEPGKVLLGGLGKKLEIHVGREGFEYGLVHYLPVLSNMRDAFRLTEVSVLCSAFDPEIRQLLEQLMQAASSPGSMGMLEKKAIFYRLLHHLLQSERLRQNQESYPLIDEAMQYIRMHHAEPLTLERLAERYRIKAKYFSYLFRKYAGIGPIDYLIQHRMNLANEMLATGQFSVSIVAKSVGYADAYYFSRLFKKRMGVPPGQVGLYRKRNRPV